jgi:CBS domain containing-hemolysin-like protein
VNDLLLALLLGLILLALDLVAIGARASFLQISHVKVLSQREQFGDRIQPTLALLPALPRLRATLNLMLVAARFSLAGLTLYLLFRKPMAQPILVAAVVLLVTALLVFWLEWVIERIVARKAELWAVRLTGFVRVSMAVLSVLLVPLALSHDKQNLLESSSLVTEDELKTLVDAGQEEGVFEQGERRMIYSIFDLGNTIAREIMVPRIDMLALDVQTPLSEAADALLRSGHSRIPVFEETVDKTLGLLYAKDLLRAWRENDQPASLRELLRPAYFVPEAKKVDELLEEMQSQRIHMAIVVDEYGGVAGLVTLEDVVEEILGEIQDEYDQAEEAPFVKKPDGSFSFLGRIALDDFNEIMDSQLSSEEADTLGGYIYHHLGRVPVVGDQVKSGAILLTVDQVSGRRIRKVGARWVTMDEREDDDDDE